MGTSEKWFSLLLLISLGSPSKKGTNKRRDHNHVAPGILVTLRLGYCQGMTLVAAVFAAAEPEDAEARWAPVLFV